MKSYIRYLYNLDLKANECNPASTPSEQESMLYEKLQALLTKEEFKTFLAFVDLYDERMANECEFYFKKGFIMASRLITECFNDDNIKENENENLF